MTKVVFVTRFSPSPVGHGGQHRAYQIVHDLRTVLGKDQVYVLSLPEWQQATQASLRKLPIWQIWGKIQRRFWYYTENPWRILRKAVFFSRNWTPPTLLHHYRQILTEFGTPALVFVEHVGFGDIVDFNISQGIPTIACVQNLESLDQGDAVSGIHLDTAVRMGDLAVEVNILARCSERLFISKVEAGLIGGIGLSARNYPYLPVGEIRENLYRIRQARSTSTCEPGLFLMVGSAGHGTTKEAFAWFVQQIRTHGLPPGVRVVVGGSDTDKLLPGGAPVRGLEVRGRLTQAELDHLLTIAQAVLVPQFRGFGALTRLPELACAGIPIAVSRHPTYAIDLPPAVQVVDDTWEAWRAFLTSATTSSSQDGSSWATYLEWEQTQPRTLTALFSEYHL